MEIRKLRQKLGWTQEELAIKLKVDRITVVRYENKDSRPSKRVKVRIERLERKINGD